MRYICIPKGLIHATLCLVIILSLGRKGYPDEIELEPITVSITPFETSRHLSPARDAAVINPDRYQAGPIDGLLDSVTGVDISTRGIMDIQSDISIRGATFEQSIVAVNNIMLNDPQTGHHNLDLALPRAAVEKIEIVKGQSTQVWAQGAIGGSLNISTKRPISTESAGYVIYGSDNTRRSCVYASLSKERKGMNIAAEESSSDGFRPGTGFRQSSISSSGIVRIYDKISSYIFAGYGEKEFGAADFYGPYNSKEWTRTLFINWQSAIEAGCFRLSPALYYRRHHDRFMLDIDIPDLYLNHHKTDIMGILIESGAGLDTLGVLRASVDINEQSIKSTVLGKDTRGRHSYSLVWENHEHVSFGYDMSVRIDDYSQYDTEVLPQAGVYIRPVDGITVRSSIARSSRPPSYTELFYDDPVNKGDKGLSPEIAMSYEAGADLVFGKDSRFDLSLTLFRRDADNLIDWVKYSASDLFFQAENITNIKIEGIETELKAQAWRWFKIMAGYAYINSDIRKREDYISKYALNRPEHKVSVQADIILPFGEQNLNMMYKNKEGYNSYLLIGCNLNYSLNQYAGIFLIIDNLFNRPYWDVKDNPLPGRQCMAGVKARF
jgi:vitamin B12 transporter